MENFLGSDALLFMQELDIIFIDLKLDYAFKLIFGKPGNEDLLLKLVNAILPEKQISSVTIKNAEQKGLRPTSRHAVFDIDCVTSNGEELTIEMQYKSQDDFNQRMVFYSSFPIQNGLPKTKKGEDTQLNFSFAPVYMIAITNFIIPKVKPNPNLINQYVISNKNDSSQVLTDNVTYVTVELPKFTKEEDNLKTPADLMLFAIKNMDSLKEMPEIYQGSGLEKMFELCRFAAMMTPEQRQYLSEFMAKLDEGSRLASAINQGRAEGEAKLAAVAVKLKAKGMKAAEISELTGLPAEQIESL